jgi:hypothetical protein
MKLTRAEYEDIALGFTLGISTAPIVGWWAIVSALASSFFWWKGGRSGNSWQVYGCSVSTFLPITLLTQQAVVIIPCVISGLLMSVGYGIPSTQPHDEGSTLGRFWWKITNQNEKLTNILTRGTIYLGLLCTLLTTYIIVQIGKNGLTLQSY